MIALAWYSRGAALASCLVFFVLASGCGGSRASLAGASVSDLGPPEMGRQNEQSPSCLVGADRLTGLSPECRSLRLEVGIADASGKQTYGFCSSVLIGGRIILSAAHCWNDAYAVRSSRAPGVIFEEPPVIYATGGVFGQARVRVLLVEKVDDPIDSLVARLVVPPVPEASSVEFVELPVDLTRALFVFHYPGGNGMRESWSSYAVDTGDRVRWLARGAQFAKGSSGAALWDEQGRVVGIHVEGDSSSLGFVPIWRILDHLGDILQAKLDDL